MALYTQTVMDHFMHPRNVGEIADADGVGEVGNAKCGDIMKMYLKIKDNKIEDVKFETFGCGSAIASSSIATEMIKGRTLDDALALTNQEVVDALGGLPAHKLHCSVLAEEAVKSAIQDYYENVREGHNFESFYNHVTEHYPEILARKHIPKDYFSLESFSLNCGEFLPGRRYENVCKDTGTDFSGKKFIVFELTQIKQDRFLSNLVMGMIFTVIQKKLLSDRRKRGVLIFDEYGETAQMVDTATGTGIHSSVAFCYQKIRKENGAVYTIIQNPDQLPENEHTKNIIANTDMLFVLPTKEVIYQSVIDRFRLTHPGQIALMKSMRNSFSGQRPYSECFMRLGEHYATVTRLEFSREKFLAFQTEGEIWSDLEEKNRRMSMEDAIEEYIREHQ